jgi:predicted amidohydrolase
MSAGLLFPGTRWIGLVLSLTIPSIGTAWPRAAAISLLITSSVCHLAVPQSMPSAADWSGVSIPRAVTADLQDDFARLEWIRAQVKASHTTYTVFPESSVGVWTVATELFWEETEAKLAAEGRTVIIGSTMPNPQVLANVAIVRGADRQVFQQRVPIPIAMWNPFSPGRFALRPLADGTMPIGKHRAAILICYEQFIAMPMLLSAFNQPDVVVVMANESWLNGTPLHAYSQSVRDGWSRLFNTPVLFAAHY